MKPVQQTKIWPEEGNCFSACVASILELPLEEVPEYENDPGAVDSWLEKWQEWLRPKNLRFLACVDPGHDLTPGYAIVSAKSPRGEFTHAVVVLDGQIVWDPHPTKGSEPIARELFQYWYLLVPLDPAKAVAHETP